MKSRNGEIFSDVVYVQLTIVCCYSKAEIKSRTLRWARVERADEMKTVLLLLKLF